MIYITLLLAVSLVAFSNGGNDNFKGVATIYGSGSATYLPSITWATLWTLAGSVASLFLAGALLKNFSGKGLVPDSLTSDPSFLFAVAVGAGSTVLLATRLGFPVSTTHSLVGGLVGVGWAGGGLSRVNLQALDHSFVLPLVLSPVLAVGTGALLYTGLHSFRWSLGLSKQSCICIGTQEGARCHPQRGLDACHAVAATTRVGVGSRPG